MARPSLLPPDVSRALRFAQTTRPRGSSAATLPAESSTSGLRSRAAIPNPNRQSPEQARVWGRVSVDHELAARVASARTAQRRTRVASDPAVHAVADRRSTGSTVVPFRSPGRRSGVATSARVFGSTADPTAVARPVRAAADAGAGVPRAVLASAPGPRIHRDTLSAIQPMATATTTAPATTPATRNTPTRMRPTAASSRAKGTPSQPTPTTTTVGSRRLGTRQLTTLTAGAVALAEDVAVASPRPKLDPAERPGRRTPRERVAPASIHVARPPRRKAKRTARQKLARKLLLGASAFALLFAVFATSIALHATLARKQLVLDDLRGQVNEAERQNQRLRVEVADLEAPEHVIAVANRLGLVAAVDTTFLTPNTGAGAVAAPTAAAPK